MVEIDAGSAEWEPFERAVTRAPVEVEVLRLEEHRAHLLISARRLCGDEQTARDLVQDTFERALKNAAQFRPGTNTRAWLVRIMSNLFIDRCRQKARRPEEVPLDETFKAPEPDAPPPWAEISIEQVTRAMERLGKDARTVVELRDVQGKSYDAIAAELGIPRPTVATRLLRARKKLKELLLGGKS